MHTLSAKSLRAPRLPAQPCPTEWIERTSQPARPPRTVKAENVGFPQDCGLVSKKPGWWDHPAKLAILFATLFIIGTGSVTGALLSTGRGFFHPGLHSTFWF